MYLAILINVKMPTIVCWHFIIYKFTMYSFLFFKKREKSASSWNSVSELEFLFVTKGAIQAKIMVSALLILINCTVT